MRPPRHRPSAAPSLPGSDPNASERVVARYWCGSSSSSPNALSHHDSPGWAGDVFGAAGAGGGGGAAVTGGGAGAGSGGGDGCGGAFLVGSGAGADGAGSPHEEGGPEGGAGGAPQFCAAGS